MISVHISNHVFKCSMCQYSTYMQHRLLDHKLEKHSAHFPRPIDLLALNRDSDSRISGQHLRVIERFKDYNHAGVIVSAIEAASGDSGDRLAQRADELIPYTKSKDMEPVPVVFGSSVSCGPTEDSVRSIASVEIGPIPLSSAKNVEPVPVVLGPNISCGPPDELVGSIASVKNRPIPCRRAKHMEPVSVVPGPSISCGPTAVCIRPVASVEIGPIPYTRTKDIEPKAVVVEHSVSCGPTENSVGSLASVEIGPIPFSRAEGMEPVHVVFKPSVSCEPTLDHVRSVASVENPQPTYDLLTTLSTTTPLITKELPTEISTYPPVITHSSSQNIYKPMKTDKELPTNPRSHIMTNALQMISLYSTCYNDSMDFPSTAETTNIATQSSVIVNNNKHDIPTSINNQQLQRIHSEELLENTNPVFENMCDLIKNVEVSKADSSNSVTLLRCSASSSINTSYENAGKFSELSRRKPKISHVKLGSDFETIEIIPGPGVLFMNDKSNTVVDDSEQILTHKDNQNSSTVMRSNPSVIGENTNNAVGDNAVLPLLITPEGSITDLERTWSAVSCDSNSCVTVTRKSTGSSTEGLSVSTSIPSEHEELSGKSSNRVESFTFAEI